MSLIWFDNVFYVSCFSLQALACKEKELLQNETNFEMPELLVNSLNLLVGLKATPNVKKLTSYSKNKPIKIKISKINKKHRATTNWLKKSGGTTKADTNKEIKHKNFLLE